MLPVPMGRSVATAAAALFLAAPAAGAVTVGQGDAVVVDGSECTVGFNGERESFTAAHCGTSGDRVRKVLDDGTWSPAIGTLDTSPRSEETTNDWARIRWDAGVELGPNEYTGDAQIPLDDIRRGETVCYYGWATGAATCGTYYARVGNSFLVDVEPGVPGDSGGPMWIPGRGFVGVISSQWAARQLPVVGGANFVVGVVPSDGPAVSQTQLMGLYMENLAAPVSRGGSSVGPAGELLRRAVSIVFGVFSRFGLPEPASVHYT